MKMFFLLILSIITITSCQNKSKLEKWLEKEEYEFYIDEEGDFCLTIQLENRKQKVWIYGEGHRVQSLRNHNAEIREIFSPAYMAEEQNQSWVQEQLMKDNYENSLWGFWGMASSQKQNLYIYQIQLNEKTKFNYLADAIMTCAVQADKLEKQLNSGMDQF